MSHRQPRSPVGKDLGVLALTALGVVYGDIGTSPLYALKEAFRGAHGVEPTPFNVLGVLSLIFWSLTLVVSYKYIAVMLKADNNGEGGILALLALIRGHEEPSGRRRIFVLAGLFGAALLYGDGVITPAVSVLGAVEGLERVDPAFKQVVVPAALLILIVLFLVQRRGTASVGRIFGPTMVIWFICISLTGLAGIIQHPEVLAAINPWHAVEFFRDDGLRGFLILGSVVLVITGGEALYADMGHFGPRPIRVAWFGMVFPALILNYFGQGALVLANPGSENPFFDLVPGWALLPMIGVSTAAAIVASQALISGAFSLTRQAVQLGYSPRVTIRHTSHTEEGQIYIPEVNTMLMVACLLCVVGFRSTANLAAAYGIAVTGTMGITTVLFARVALRRWQWPVWRVAAVTGLFLVVDLSFLSANLVKFADGGWFPLVLAAGVFILLSTWKRGRLLLTTIQHEGALPLELLIKDLEKRPIVRVPGTAVFMTSDVTGVPPVMLHHLKHNKMLHERVLIMSVGTEEVPSVPDDERIELRDLSLGFHVVVAHYGFMESPDVPHLLHLLSGRGLQIKVAETSFYLGRETILPTGTTELAPWRKRLFILMSRNAQSAATFFNLPPNRVVELGAQIQL